METLHEEALAAAGARPDGTIDINAAMRSMLEGLLNAVTDEQASELGVPRNGYRKRGLDTCAGTVTLRIPRLMEGGSFPDDVVRRWSRTDTALASAICDMLLSVASAREIEATESRDNAGPSALAYLDFPREHATWVRANDVQERMSCEIKRRARVVQVFPSLDSLVRLVGGRCAATRTTRGWPRGTHRPQVARARVRARTPARGAGLGQQGTEARPRGVQQEEEGGVASGADHAPPREGPYTTFRDATRENGGSIIGLARRHRRQYRFVGPSPRRHRISIARNLESVRGCHRHRRHRIPHRRARLLARALSAPAACRRSAGRFAASAIFSCVCAPSCSPSVGTAFRIRQAKKSLSPISRREQAVCVSQMEFDEMAQRVLNLSAHAATSNNSKLG